LKFLSSSAFLYFVSENSVTSNHSRNEVNFMPDLDTLIRRSSHRRDQAVRKRIIGAKQTIMRYEFSSPKIRRYGLSLEALAASAKFVGNAQEVARVVVFV
jgi:hypothetical protein